MKWSFKDLFLFRSALEERVADKDQFRKYRALRRYESEAIIESECQEEEDQFLLMNCIIL